MHTISEVIKKVVLGENPCYRPQTPISEDEDEVDVRLIKLMHDSWSEKPDHRPTFMEINKRLKIINKGK